VGDGGTEQEPNASCFGCNLKCVRTFPIGAQLPGAKMAVINGPISGSTASLRSTHSLIFARFSLGIEKRCRREIDPNEQIFIHIADGGCGSTAVPGPCAA